MLRLLQFNNRVALSPCNRPLYFRLTSDPADFESGKPIKNDQTTR